MKLSARDLAQLKRVIKAAKEKYYNSGKFLRLHTDQLDDNIAILIVDCHLSKGKVVWPKGEVEIPDKYIQITDAVYDVLEQALREVEPNSPLLKETRTAAAPAGVRQQEVKLPYLMPSLDKKLVGAGTLEKWLAKNPGPYIIMDKLDGMSMELIWENAKFAHIYKGGSADKGLDWSNALDHIKLPKKAPAGDGAVRCEIIMSKAEFVKKWSKEHGTGKYSNARNLTAGVVNKIRGLHEAIGSVEPMVLDVLHKRMKPSAALAWAEQQGFKVVHHITATMITEDKLVKYLKVREKADHMIDGLVIAVDKPFALTEDNPKTMIAFKAPSEGNNAIAKVVKVWWEVSKHRLLKPRIEIEPVQLAGVHVKFATAYNGRFVQDNCLGPGAVVEITRSGEVIPKILSVQKKATSGKPQMPTEGFEWNKTHVDVMLVEGVKHEGAEVKRIASFMADGLGVEFVAGGILTKMYDSGFDTIKKLLTASVAQFLRVDGIKDKMAQKIYDQIQSKIKDADLNDVAANSGFFGNGMGSRRIKLISDKYDLFQLAALPKAQIQAKVLTIHGFSDITAKQFADHLAEFVAWVQKMPITFKKAAVVKVSGSKMKGQAVCFTGVRSAEAEQKIVQQGGTVVSGVNAKTTILVCKDPSSNSSKAEKARQLGIKIVTLAQLLKLLG